MADTFDTSAFDLGKDPFGALRTDGSSFPDFELGFKETTFFPKGVAPLNPNVFTSDDFANKHFENTPISDVNGTPIYSIQGLLGYSGFSNGSELKESPVAEIVDYKYRYAKQIAGIEVVLFYTEKGDFLLDDWKKTSPSSHQILLFIEKEGGTNLFGSVLHFKVGSSVGSQSTLPVADYLSFLHEQVLEVDKEKVEELLQTAFLGEKAGLFSYFYGAAMQIASDFGALLSVASNFFNAAGDLFFKDIGGFLDGLKIPKTVWNGDDLFLVPDALEQPILSAFSLKSAQGKEYQNFVQTQFDQVRALEKAIKIQLNRELLKDFDLAYLSQFAQQLFDLAYEVEQSFLEPGESLLKTISQGIQALVAFVCGVVNSLMSALAGIFQLIGLILYTDGFLAKSASQIHFYFSWTLEYVETLLDQILRLDFKKVANSLVVLASLPRVLAPAIIDYLGQQDIDLREIANFIGSLVGLIIEEALYVLASGGTLNIALLLAKVFKEPFQQGAKALAKATKAGAQLTQNIVEKILKMLAEDLPALLKKLENPEAFIDEIVGAIRSLLKFPSRSISDLLKLVPSKYRSTLSKDLEANPDLVILFSEEVALLDSWKKLDDLGDEAFDQLRKDPDFLKRFDNVVKNDKLNSHTFVGDVTRKVDANGVVKYEVSGIHSNKAFTDGTTRIKLGTQIDGLGDGFYKAKVEKQIDGFVNDHGTNWKVKAKKSTFFPDNWSTDKIRAEIAHAFKNKTSLGGTKYQGTTTTGHNVVMFLDDAGKIKTAFPSF